MKRLYDDNLIDAHHEQKNYSALIGKIILFELLFPLSINMN